MSFTYAHARPAVTVDVALFGLDHDDLKVLLIRRALEPFEGRWALPGGFVQTDEALEDAARRELREETGIEDIFIEQLYTFGDLGRDPRERVISVTYFGLVNLADHSVRAATDAREVGWFGIDDVPGLSFDHDHILEVAVTRLKGKVRYQPIGFELLPEKFTLRQLQSMYEKILERTLDKRNFRKKVLNTGLLLELDEVEQDVAHRAARMYRFDEAKYQELEKQGIYFEI